jgi:hypothetical protein
MSIFKTKKAHINEIKGAIQFHNGPVYFHGTGDIYPVLSNAPEGHMHPSDFRVKHSNPAREEAKYRIKFNSIQEVPGTVEEINDLLMKSKERERAENEKVVISGGVQNFKAYQEPDETEAAQETGGADQAAAAVEQEPAKIEKPGKGKK